MERWSRRKVLTAGAAGAGLGVATSVLGPEVVKFLIAAEQTERLAEATRIYREASQRGEFAFGLPQVVLDEKGRIEDSTRPVSHVEFLIPHTSGEKEIVFPAPVEGTLKHRNPSYEGDVSITQSGIEWDIWVSYAKNVSSLVRSGQDLSMGDPLFRINLERYSYGPNVVVPSFDGVVVWLRVGYPGNIQGYPSVNIQELTKDKLIRRPGTNQPLTIPVRRS